MKSSFFSFLVLFITLAGSSIGYTQDESGIGDHENPLSSQMESSQSDTILPDSLESDTIEEFPPIESMPELTEFVKADYPESVHKKGIEGTVVMTLLVDENGTVDSVAVENGIHPVLDSNAVKAARQFAFQPAIAGGEPVPVLLQYEYHFTLTEVLNSIPRYSNFSGKLLEQGTRRPVADALVAIVFRDTASDTSLPVPFSRYLEKIGTFHGQHIEEGRLVTTTDSLGQFHFYSVPACTILIVIPHSEYKKFTEKEHIRYKEETSVTYYLERLSYSEYEIVVYGKRQEKEVSRRQLSIQEVRKIPGLGGDAVKVIQAMPGVSRPAMGSGEIVVRGAPTWDSRFFLDGVDLPQLYHFGGLKSTYNSDALESIDFYPGGFNTRYGGGTAGVIEIIGRSPKTDRWHGNVDMGTIDGSFLVEGPVNEKVSVLASARRSFAGEIISWFIDNSPVELPLSVSPYYWDYLLRTDYAIDEGNSVHVTAFGSRDSLTMKVSGMQGGTEEIDKAKERFGMAMMFHQGMVGWDKKISDKMENKLRLALGTNHQFFSVFGYVKTKANAFGLTLRDQITFTINDRFLLNSGIDFSQGWLDFYLTIPQGDDLLRQYDEKNWLFGILGGYINAEWRLTDKLLLVPGLRYDYFMELDYDGPYAPSFWDYEAFENTTPLPGEPSFRLTGRYSLKKEHTVKAAIGNYSQSPQPIGQVIMDGWGDPHLPATRAAHYILGYEWQITDLIHTDVQCYLNRQWNIPRMADTGDLEADDLKLWLGDEQGRMRGLELMIRHDQGKHFFGWIAYTLSLSERINPTTDGWVLFSDDETHHVQMVGSWVLPQNWETGVRVRYVTGKPYTPVVSAFEDETHNGFFAEMGKENSVRRDPFFQIDARVDKKFIFKKWILSTYIDLQNVSYLLYKSPEFEMYNAFYDDKISISSVFIPGIGMKAEF